MYCLKTCLLKIFDMKILVLGASGLLGNTFWIFKKSSKISESILHLEKEKGKNIFVFDVHNKSTHKNIKKLRPDFVINCIGAIKPL